MRASEGKRLCQEARVYYYDLLGPDEAAVPLSVRRHAAMCDFCRAQMGRLRETLFKSELEAGGSDAPEDATIETLAEQFRLLDERVTCSDARSCLPQLAMAAPQIRIPTPITVHVDQCPECARDLKAIRRLRLTTDQLRRLGQLFASRNGEGFLPRPAHAGGGAPVGPRPALMSPRQASGPVGSGCCPVEGVVMACHEVSEADIFDSVVPFDLPLDERRKAAAAHIRACPVCLGRVRKLQGTIDEIVARADSKIKTVYHAAQDTPDGSSEGQDAYQYPVSVEVVHAGSAADEPNGLQGISRACRRALRRSAAPLARMAAVGVIILALATLLRTTAPTASGTSAGQLRKAVEKAPNVQVVVTHHLAGPIQGSLIARRLGRLVQRTGQTYIVYDVNHRLKRTLEPQTGSGAPTGMSKHECDWARQAMASSLLDILERVSPATRLHRPVDDAGKETEKGLDVYEFQPSPQAGSPLVQSRYWVYIDSTTGLPQKMEYYQRVPSASEWRLITIRVYTYPTDQEAEDNIQALLAAR